MVEDNTMVGGSERLDLNKFTQQVYQQLQKGGSNRSGGLDLNEIKERIDVTGNGQELTDNFDSIDIDGNAELSTGELIAFRGKFGERQSELLNQLQSIFQQSEISTDTISSFLKGQNNQESDLPSLLQTGTNLDSLIESRVREILTVSEELSDSTPSDFRAIF
jgi:hypothetical protein